MHVSSEVRRRDFSDAIQDPAPYAFAPGAANFMSILTELKAMTDEGARTNSLAAPAESEGSGTVVATGEATPEGTPVVQEDTSGPEAPSESRVGSDEARVTVTDDPTPLDIDVTATPSTGLEPDDTGAYEIVETAALENSRENMLPQMAGTEPASITAALAAGASGNAPRVAAHVEQPADTHALTELVATLEEVTGTTVSVDVEGGEPLSEASHPSAPVFAKTLNAFLAEGAVRVRQDNAAATINGAAQESSADALPTTDALERPVDEPQNPPPLSRAAALDLGGVRPEAPATTRLPMANLPGELAQHIHLMRQEGTRTMRLRLVPEHLGELRIEIQGSGDTLRVRLISPNAAVRDALNSQVGDLKDAFHKQGLSLDQATVDSGAGRQQTAPEERKPPVVPAYQILSAELPREAPAPRRVLEASAADISTSLNLFA